MLKRSLFLIIFLVLSCIIFAQTFVLSVSDFPVESENPAYKHIGKGISRLIAGELRKSKSIKIIEREQINKIIEEQKFSISGLADTDNQIELGKLASAEFILFGEIIDMAGTVMVSVRMVNVNSGEVVWQNDLIEKLDSYDYIGSYFALSVLDHFNITADSSTIAKSQEKEIKSADNVVLLSEGIDAFDRNDMTGARDAFETVTKLDKSSEVAEFYLSKLVTNTSKFKVITEQYISYQNPAYLGIIRTDRFHFAASQSLSRDNHGEPIFATELDNGYMLIEADMFRGSLGYYFPVAEKLGIGVEVFGFSYADRIYDDLSSTVVSSSPDASGIILSTGRLTGNNFAVGIGLSTYYKKQRAEDIINHYWEDPRYSWCFAVSPGFLLRNNDESIVFDSRFAWSSEKVTTIDGDTFLLEEDISMPLYLENTLTLAMNSRKTFVVIKQINDLALDRKFYNGRILPAVEHFPVNWLSVRTGIEGAYAVLGDSNSFGFGTMGGLTFRFIKIGLDIDFNFTYRKRPSRVVQNIMYEDYIFLISGTLSDKFFSR